MNYHPWDLTPIHQIPILDIAHRLGVQVRGKKAMCFAGHDKRTPSLTFSTDKNTWRCFGACGKGGDGITLVMEKLGVDFKAAVNWLSNEFHVDMGQHGHRSYLRADRLKSQASSLPEVRSSKESKFLPDPELYTWLISKCQPISQARGLDYLKNHGIPLGVATRFGLRELRDPERALLNMIDRWGTKRVLQGGLAWGDAAKPERMIWTSYTILFPFFCEGVVEYIQGRLFKGNAKYLGPRGIEKPLFNLDSLVSLPPGSIVHICEGIPDALALEANGLHAVAVLGANSFRAEWVEFLMKYDVVLMPDGDSGGETFHRKIFEAFLARGKAVRRVRIPAGKDAAAVIAEMRKRT
jgi:DNA primase